ncbi:MAG: hypothetical protein KBA46_03265 [Candidatus Omnitrophica bacterium]|nr:hypothetical protein [Candidatus Omnitrophota bacterium]
MKKLSCVVILFLVVTSFGICQELDTVPFHLQDEECTLVLHDSHSFNDFWGVYRLEIVPTYDYLVELHLFPNNKFIYIYGNRIIADGTYSFETSKIFLSYKYIDNQFKDMAKDRSFNVAWSQVRLLGIARVLINDTELEKLRLGDRTYHYMWRRREYNDWREIYNQCMELLQLQLQIIKDTNQPSPNAKQQSE